ncbi:uncharacterized protein LOC115087836 isoform X11 [Rhinatrema bivittatum]|uniref:uncharacterized protein LOC115087836 isoform X11 n=1 Tax=Rhinatrema bivittatum TaxID=194408 RepID=UPI00112D00A5|nr:uncharacterized protein LOC115087836 isoform X11 [Rhinatrema bivittatum]
MASPAAEKHVFLFPDSKVYSGTVIMPGGFDQQGCSLVIFPKSQHCKLSDLSNEDLGNVFKYFLHLHNTHQFGCCMISVVVDLRTATLDILSHIVNGLLHVQNHLGSILGTFYALQPQRKELRKFLLKSLRLCQKRGLLESPLKCILPNKACDLFSYIDQSQLTSEFGGYFMYEHEKWVCFRKEMDGFSRQYTSVFKRLPSCLVRLEALGCEPFPSRQEELKGFSQQIQNSYTSLRRWLGIDDLQSKCESIVHKFQKREVDCYQAVSGTIMFNLAFVNVLNHRQRIRASMDKMEWLWQKACAKIQFSLKKLEYKQAAQEIIEFISTQAMRKLEAYEIQIASSISQAEVLRQEYMSAIYDPAMILLEHVADVIENLECLEGGNEVEDYIWQLWKLKERFSAAVEIPFQTLKSIHDYHYLFNKEEEHILKHEKEMEHFLEMEMLKSEKQEIAENIQNLDCVHQVMSPKELSEAGVIGIQDFHCSETEPEDYSFQFVSQSEKLGNKLGLSDTVNQTLSQRTVVLTGPPYSEFLKELKDLYHIEEKIWEENMKLEELRDMQQLENCQERNSLNQIKKQLLFLIQLQRERNEVEKLEYSFANEEAKQKLNLRKKLYEIPDLEMCHSAKQIAKTIVKSLSKFSAKSVNWPVSTTSSDLLSKKCNEKETCQLVNCSDTHSPITQQLQEKPIDAKNSVPVESSEVSSQKNLQDSRSVVGSETVFHSLTNPILETKAFLKKAILSHKTHALSKLTNLQCRECASEESIQSDTVNDMKRVKDNSAVISTKKKVEMLQSVQLCLNKNRIELNRICNPAEQRTRNRNGRATHKSLGKQDKMVGVSPLLKGQNLEMLNGAVKPSLPHITEIITPGINSRKSKQVCSEENVYASSNRLYNIAFCEEPSEDSLISPPRCPIGTTLHISAMKLSDYSFPIVLDIRSGLMKAGFANLDLPVTVFPTIIGLPKYEEAVSSNTENIYIGHEAQHIKSVLNIKNPVTHGIVTDWDDLEKIWHYTFYDQLHADPEQHPVMLTETAMNPESRAHMVQIMFEAFSVPFAYIAVQAVLALYSTGRTSGVVFDSGDDVSYSVPVYEGYSLPHAIQRLNLAGCDLTNYLQKLLQKNGCLFRAPTQEIAREMKEKCCYVAQDAETELPSEVHYNLPDGQSITLSTERFRAPEVLFKQELIGKDQDGVHESLCRSLLLTDVDLRKTFAENLVLSGGNTLLTGLPLRLQKEICSLVPVNLRDSVSVTSVPDQDFAVWNGGAALVSSPAFHTAWISKQEYDEFGPDIVYKRCF